MDFAGAIKAGFKNYAKFRGRATRPEYWWFVLFNLIADILYGLLDPRIRYD